MMKTMTETVFKKSRASSVEHRESASVPALDARLSALESQAGYTIVTMLAMMTLFALALMAAAPSIQQSIQREKELEAIRRGEEVAQAIEQYVNFYQGAKLPNSIDDLLEGLPAGTKKRQILRASAAIDPLSEDGKWLLVGVESKSMQQFARRVQNYNNGSLPSSESVHQAVVNKVGMFITSLDTGSEEDSTESADETDAAEDLSSDNKPFVGVVSQSKSRAVIAYYGIENHSKWVFTPLFRGSGTTAIRPNTNRTPPVP
jgi:type II secretory pathway pseudopilin PulG